MVAVAVRTVGGDRRPGIAARVGSAIGRLRPQRVERTAVDAQLRARRGATGRRHRVDRAAKRRSAQPQRIGAAIDLDLLEDLRVQFLEIAIVVGQVDRHAVLQQRQPAHMIAARQAGTPDGNAHLLPEARLGIDAGREGQRVTQGNHDLVLEIIGGNDVHAARRAPDLCGGGLGERTGGDDDARPVLRLLGESRNGIKNGSEDAQRNAARDGREHHGKGNLAEKGMAAPLRADAGKRSFQKAAGGPDEGGGGAASRAMKPVLSAKAIGPKASCQPGSATSARASGGTLGCVAPPA